jgi:hypothetical protein
MTNLVRLSRQLTSLQRAAVAALFAALVFGAQSPLTQGQTPVPPEKTAPGNPLSGKYEGVAKGASNETQLTLEIVDDGGKLSGRLVTPQGASSITEGTFTDGKLALKFGADSALTAQLQGDRLIGEWTSSGQKRSVELKRVPTIADEASRVIASANPPVPLTGDWDGLADAQGQGFPFVLTLKVEGEKVTGESNSSLGSATISNGTFKDGKLLFQLDSQSGPIYVSAVLKDGGLVGEFDFPGQAQGSWVAKKRNP